MMGVVTNLKIAFEDFIDRHRSDKKWHLYDLRDLRLNQGLVLVDNEWITLPKEAFAWLDSNVGERYYARYRDGDLIDYGRLLELRFQSRRDLVAFKLYFAGR